MAAPGDPAVGAAEIPAPAELGRGSWQVPISTPPTLAADGDRFDLSLGLDATRDGP